MSFTATLTNIERVDQSLNVEVLFEDSATGFANKRVFNFNNADSITLPEIRTKVIEQGTIYKNALSTESTLKNNIGTKITI